MVLQTMVDIIIIIIWNTKKLLSLFEIIINKTKTDCNYFAVRNSYYYVYMLEVVTYEWYDYYTASDISLWKSSLKNIVNINVFVLYIMIRFAFVCVSIFSCELWCVVIFFEL